MAMTIAFLASLLPQGVPSVVAAPQPAADAPILAAAAPVEPVTLGFDAAVAGTIADKDGEGTGFTSVQPSSNGGGYLPANLDVNPTSPGTLDITTTSGIQFKTPTTTGGAANGQHNALAVAYDGTSGPVRIETTLINPPAGSTGSEQAGLWFGTSEDNYAKLVLGATSATQMRVQLMKEVGGASTASTD
jgi:hypothetical protein